MLTLIVALAFFSATAIPHETELKDTVSSHWTLLAKNQKFEALKNVLDGCQNEFINRREPIVLSWKYVEAKPVAENEAQVNVEIETVIPNVSGTQKMNRIENWVWTGEAWKLKLEKASASGVIGKIAAGSKPPVKSLVVTPAQVKIKFFNPVQVGLLKIINGTEQPVDVLGVTVDEKRFEVVSRPEAVAPGVSAFIKIKYKETEDAKNQRSQLTLRLKEAGAERLFEIPVIYNYISDADLAFWGLTKEKAEPIKHQDKRKYKPTLGKLDATQINGSKKQPTGPPAQSGQPAQPAQP